ncbi:MAG: hypothetical protein AAB152_10535 [Candidatus Coatesbacteria bacterium]
MTGNARIAVAVAALAFLPASKATAAAIPLKLAWIRAGMQIQFTRVIQTDAGTFAGGLAMASDERTGLPSITGVLVRMDRNGKDLWRRGLLDDPEAIATLNDLILDDAGNLVAAGFASPEGTVPLLTIMGSEHGRRWVVAKYGPDGAILWSRTYNHSEQDNDMANAVATDPEGAVYAVGTEHRHDLGQQANWHIRKYDARGALQWTASFSGTAGGDDVAVAARWLKTGELAVYGSEATGGWMIRGYGPDGAQRWTTGRLSEETAGSATDKRGLASSPAGDVWAYHQQGADLITDIVSAGTAGRVRKSVFKSPGTSGGAWGQTADGRPCHAVVQQDPVAPGREQFVIEVFNLDGTMTRRFIYTPDRPTGMKAVDVWIDESHRACFVSGLNADASALFCLRFVEP